MFTVGGAQFTVGRAVFTVGGAHKRGRGTPKWYRGRFFGGAFIFSKCE